MKLSRDAIQRMVEAGGGSGGGGGLSQSQIDAMLAGYAQRSWVDKNYLSIEFFSSIFRIHSTEAGGDNDLIEPNSQLPQDTSHVNIEAMFGTSRRCLDSGLTSTSRRWERAPQVSPLHSSFRRWAMCRYQAQQTARC